jgi:hypothetical protein
MGEVHYPRCSDTARLLPSAKDTTVAYAEQLLVLVY